jgi:lysophospholipase L1-like esterase
VSNTKIAYAIAKQRAVPARLTLISAVAMLALAGASPAAHAQPTGEHWVGTWAAPPQPVWGTDFPVPWNIPRNLWNQTVRQIAHVSIGGSRVRVIVSNEFGTAPLTVGTARIARAGSGAAIVGGTDHALTFGGAPSITIPPGAPAISDPVDLDVPALGDVAVSLFLPRVTPVATAHWEGVQTAYISATGDHTADAEIKPEATIKARVFLSGILVEAPADAAAVVTFGDSITDGADSTPDANHRWPDFLAARLQKSGLQHFAVLNEGISGERVLSDRMGLNALASFDREILSWPHVQTVVLMMGINDIGWPETPLAPGERVPPVSEIIDGYRQLIAAAHLHGIRILGATLTPFNDAFEGKPFEGYYTPAKEAKRQAVNAFIRSPGSGFDGVIDFDAAVRDAADPSRIKAQFDSGDHLHPNDAGYAAMADAIDLGMLTRLH